MVSRVVKSMLRSKMRKITAPGEEPIRRLVVSFFNLVLGTSQACVAAFRARPLLIRERQQSEVDSLLALGDKGAFQVFFHCLEQFAFFFFFFPCWTQFQYVGPSTGQVR